MFGEEKLKACTSCTDLHTWNFNRFDSQLYHLILIIEQQNQNQSKQNPNNNKKPPKPHNLLS